MRWQKFCPVGQGRLSLEFRPLEFVRLNTKHGRNPKAATSHCDSSHGPPLMQLDSLSTPCLADVGDLVGEEEAKSFNVNGRARWYSTTTQQDVDGLPQFPRVRQFSFSLVAPKTLCPSVPQLTVKTVIYPTCVVLQHASQRRIQDMPRGDHGDKAPIRRSGGGSPSGVQGQSL